MFQALKFCVVCILLLQVLTVTVSSFESEEYQRKIHTKSLCDGEKVCAFWSDVPGQEYVSKLNQSTDLDSFNRQFSDTFVMFYSNWCKASKHAAEGFAVAARDVAFTEGFGHVSFGAFDCSGNAGNLKACRKTYNVTKYPSFLYFKDGQRDRQYTIRCPRHAEFFYNWILDHGDEKYCSGALSSSLASSGYSAICMKQVSVFMSMVSIFLAWNAAN